jgi:hypothetical protein
MKRVTTAERLGDTPNGSAGNRWLGALSHRRGVDNRAQPDVFAVGLPPANFASTTRVQAEVTLVHRHVDENKIGDVAERADHFRWLRFRSTRR